MVWQWLYVFLVVFYVVDPIYLVGDLVLYLNGWTPISAYAHDNPLFFILVVGFQLVGVFALFLHLYNY